MSKETPLEVASAGEVFLTVITLVPPAETSDAGIMAFNCVLPTYSVDLADPLHCTMELLLKFVPFTVSVKPLLPAETLLGEIDVMEGGLVGVTIGGEEDPPPQLNRKSPVAIRMAGITE